LTNSGSEAVDLTGWSLQSDPSTESYDLTAAGTLTAGASVFINSGSGATGAFVWSTAEIFRNGDATDFVSLMDAGGAVVGTVNCPASTPAANGIPDGGGPPGESSALAAGVVAAAAGALLVVLTTVLGLVWMGIGLLKRGRAVDAPEILERPPEPAPETNEAAVGEAASYDAAPSGPIPAHVPPGAVAADARSEANLWPYLIFVVGAIAMVVILLLAGSAGSRKK
jgi:hypothetical protein